MPRLSLHHGWAGARVTAKKTMMNNTHIKLMARATVIALVLICCGAASAAGVDHSPFDKILRENVAEDGRVSYTGIRERAWFDLHVYLDLLANTRVDTLPRDEQLALYLNLYNATVIKAVIDRMHERYSPADDDSALFKAPLVHTGGRQISLDELEHHLIRPTFKDPRVHVALVCAARSCPPLLGRAYKAEDLDAVLEQNMRRFVNDPTRNTIDHANRKLVLSKIFDWYAADFGGPDKIAAYVSRYADGGPVDGFTATFRDYDWTLNKQ